MSFCRTTLASRWAVRRSSPNLTVETPPNIGGYVVASKREQSGSNDKNRSGSGKTPAARRPAKKATPTVKQFLAKLGGAPDARGKKTPAKGLLGDIRREDLVRAGRIDEGSTEGPPADRSTPPTAAVQEDAGRSNPSLDGSQPAGGPLQVELAIAEAAKPQRDPRVPWKETVRVSSVFSGLPIDGTAQNLSPGGIFVETADVLEEGDPVLLAFPGAGGQALNISGRVRWVTPFGDLSDARAGMGIEFVGLDARKRDRLERILDGIPRSPERR